MIKDFLPICKADMEARGWDSVEFVLVIGDANLEQTDIGPALISKIIEAKK